MIQTVIVKCDGTLDGCDEYPGGLGPDENLMCSSITEARALARRAQWRHTKQGLDLCPCCAKKMLRR